MTPRHYELATGSRACDDTDAAREWARGIARDLVASLPPRAVVVVGDALGFDALVRVAALAEDFTVLVFALSGTVHRYDGPGLPVEAGRWTVAAPPARGSPDAARWPLARNDAMVAYVARRAAEGSPVHCTGAVCPWRRPGRERATQGTQHTMGEAMRAGVTVAQYVCPAEHGPGEVRRG